MAEFSDMPLTLPPNEETYHDIFRAKHVTTYLDEYVDKNVFQGRSLRERIKFGYTVRKAERTENGWILQGNHGSEGTDQSISCSKLMVAAGLTSEPNMPDLPEKHRYQGMLLHQKAFGGASILSNPDVKRVAIIGAGKSAADMVYASAKAGKSTVWIIRQSGTGPAAFIDIKGHGRYKNAAEIGHTRMMIPMMPSCFAESTLFSRFIQKTKFGQIVGKKVWQNADRDIHLEANYHGREGARNGYSNLEPETVEGIERPSDWV